MMRVMEDDPEEEKPKKGLFSLTFLITSFSFLLLR
jgi:hypothetical protein